MPYPTLDATMPGIPVYVSIYDTYDKVCRGRMIEISNNTCVYSHLSRMYDEVVEGK